MAEAESNMLTEDHHDTVNPQKLSQKEKNPLDVLLFMTWWKNGGRGEEHMGCHSPINRGLS